jgi:hypothetical protein
MICYGAGISIAPDPDLTPLGPGRPQDRGVFLFRKGSRPFSGRCTEILDGGSMYRSAAPCERPGTEIDHPLRGDRTREQGSRAILSSAQDSRRTSIERLRH